MIENQLSAADTPSEAQGANPGFDADIARTRAPDARSAFDFDQQQGAADSQSIAPATLKDKALRRLQSEADNRKGVVSEQLKQVSGALRSMGESGGETPQWLSSGVGQVTQLVDRIADKVENRNTAELVDDVRGFARANPAVFLGAAALVGFAAIRIFSGAGNGR